MPPRPESCRGLRGSSTTDRISWLERANDDFPYYRGEPVEVDGGRWWIVVAAVAVGFLAPIYAQPLLRSGLAGIVPAILFVGIPLAALAVSVMFALAHLPTYRWNLPQALVGLVPVRLVLLLPYLMTNNLWVSSGTHILNDRLIFGLPLLVGGAGDAAGG